MSLFSDAVAACGKLPPAERLHRAREFVHIGALQSLGQSGAWEQMSFVGGTALRCAHGLPRYSEDLDFSTHDERAIPLDGWLEGARDYLKSQGFAAEFKSMKPKEGVVRGELRVRELRHAIGDAPMPESVLMVKVEVDARPPAGAEHSIVQTRLPGLPSLDVRMHDLSSLMAGKVHALICRSYLKGRDWYDLAWYRRQCPPVSPNLAQLQAALNQTTTRAGVPEIDARDWRSILHDKAAALDWDKLNEDVAPFVPGATLDFDRDDLLSMTRSQVVGL